DIVAASVPNTHSGGYSTFSLDFSRLGLSAAIQFVSEYSSPRTTTPRIELASNSLFRMQMASWCSMNLQRRLVDCVNVVKTTSFMRPVQQIQQAPKEA